MSITPLGFLETSGMTALWVRKYRKDAVDGILALCDEEAELPILKEWRSAAAVLTRIRTEAAKLNVFGGVAPELGKAWIEVVPPECGTPWLVETSEYADRHFRTRTALIYNPNNISYCGPAFATLNVGVVNLFDMQQLCSEVNLGDHARVHLVVDVRAPESGEESDAE